MPIPGKGMGGLSGHLMGELLALADDVAPLALTPPLHFPIPLQRRQCQRSLRLQVRWLVWIPCPRQQWQILLPHRPLQMTQSPCISQR